VGWGVMLPAHLFCEKSAIARVLDTGSNPAAASLLLVAGVEFRIIGL
jgi:hypothetical protein